MSSAETLVEEQTDEVPRHIAVNVADLYALHTSLRFAWDYHRRKDQMNAAAHMSEPQYRELTKSLFESAKLVEELLDYAAEME